MEGGKPVDAENQSLWNLSPGWISAYDLGWLQLDIIAAPQTTLKTSDLACDRFRSAPTDKQPALPLAIHFADWIVAASTDGLPFSP
jgi:hypothetical protein